MTRRRFDLTDFEWSVIQPLLPNKPRGVPRVDDRRVINGILWRFRTGSPWADVPVRYGPYTTCYNRFVRCDLPLNFHPAAIRASAFFDTPNGAVGATGGNRSFQIAQRWSRLRRLSRHRLPGSGIRAMSAARNCCNRQSIRQWLCGHGRGRRTGFHSATRRACGR